MRAAAVKIHALITALSERAAARFGVSPQFFRFLIVGGVNTGFSYLAYLFLLWLSGWAVLAYSLTFLLFVPFSYFLNLKLTFQTAHSGKKFFSFPLVFVVQYFVGLAVFKISLLIGAPAEIAVFPVLLVNIPVSFLLSRLLLQ